MAQNFVCEGDVLQLPISATVTTGSPIVVGSRIGVALGSGVSGDTIRVAMEGVFTCPKLTGAAITVGAVVYWDDTAKKMTVTAGSNLVAGYCYAAEASGATTVQVKFLG